MGGNDTISDADNQAAGGAGSTRAPLNQAVA